MKMTEVYFYDKEGREFTDQVTVVPKYNEDEVRSANNENVVCAKKEKYDNDLERFYIKFCNTGGNAGHFANPFGSLYRPGELIAFDKMSGRRWYEYTPVSSDVFENYTRFLQSRNPSYLRHAEREFINAPR